MLKKSGDADGHFNCVSSLQTNSTGPSCAQRAEIHATLMGCPILHTRIGLAETALSASTLRPGILLLFVTDKWFYFLLSSYFLFGSLLNVLAFLYLFFTVFSLCFALFWLIFNTVQYNCIAKSASANTVYDANLVFSIYTCSMKENHACNVCMITPI